MYKIVEYKGYKTIIHSNEFNPNEMTMLYISDYNDCVKQLNKLI